MEPLFSVDYSPSKKLYHEFGNIHAKRSKAWIVMLVCIILLMILTVIRAVTEGRIELVSLIPTVLFYFMWLFSDLYVGTLSYNSTNKTVRSEGGRMFFTEDEQISEASTGISKVSYAAFPDAYESDGLFALYTSKTSAILVPKAGFTQGTVDDFRDFITRKIGSVRRVASPKRKRIWGIVLGVCFVLAMVGGLSFNRYWVNRSVSYGRAPYSISLPANFKTFSSADYVLSASTDDVYVYVYAESKQSLHSYGFEDIETVEDYADLFAETYASDGCTRTSLDNSTLCLTYTIEYPDGTLFYCDALTESDGLFWVTEFYCLTSDQAEYEPLFYEWASTIQIAN